MDGEEILISGRVASSSLSMTTWRHERCQHHNDVLRDFSAKRMENGVAGPTVNRNLAMLRRMFKLAEREASLEHSVLPDAEGIRAA